MCVYIYICTVYTYLYIHILKLHIIHIYIYIYIYYMELLAGGITRQKLLKEFIEKCFQPLDSGANVATLLHVKVLASMCEFHSTCRAVLL